MDDQDEEDASSYVAKGGDVEAARAALTLLRISRDASAAGYRFPDDDITEEKQEDHPDPAQLLTGKDLDLFNRLSTMHVSIKNAKTASDILEKLQVYGKAVENLTLRVVKDYRDLGVIVDGDLQRPPYARVSSVCLFKKVEAQDSRNGFRLAPHLIEGKFYGFMKQREKKLAETKTGIQLDAYCTSNSKLYRGIKLAKVSWNAFVFSSDAWTEFWEDHNIMPLTHGISIWFLRKQRKKLSLFLAAGRVANRRGANRT